MPEANTPRDQKPLAPEDGDDGKEDAHRHRRARGEAVHAVGEVTELTVPTMTKAAKMTYSGSEIGTVLFQNGMYRLSSAT